MITGMRIGEPQRVVEDIPAPIPAPRFDPPIPKPEPREPVRQPEREPVLVPVRRGQVGEGRLLVSWSGTVCTICGRELMEVETDEGFALVCPEHGVVSGG